MLELLQEFVGALAKVTIDLFELGAIVGIGYGIFKLVIWSARKIKTSIEG